VRGLRGDGVIAEYIGIAIAIVISAAILLPQAWRALKGHDPFGAPLSRDWSPRRDRQPYSTEHEKDE
jgi:hypothetical protein